MKQVEKWVLLSIELKPIDISNYSQQLLFKYGHKTLLMSATILDKKKYCRLIYLHSNVNNS